MRNGIEDPETGGLGRREFLAGAGAISVALLSAKSASAASGSRDEAAAKLIGEISGELLAEYPDSATFLGLDKGARSGLAARLPDRSPRGDHARAASCARRLGRLKAFDRTDLSDDMLVNIDTVTYAHDLADAGYRQFPFGDNAILGIWQVQNVSPYIVSQASGCFATMPDFLESQHGVETGTNAEAYVERLEAFARNLDGETRIIRRDAASGIALPDFILDTVIAQQEAYLAQPGDQWGLATTFARRTANKDIAGRWQERAAASCKQRVEPALQRQLATLRSIRRDAKSDPGCWKLPDGEAYYEWALKGGTTTSLTADELHRSGLAQVEEISSEMDRHLRQIGCPQGAVGARLAAIGKDPRYFFANDEAGKRALIDYLNQRIDLVRAKLPQAFRENHSADLVIRRVPAAIEAGAPAAYAVDGPLDGSRPSTYFINLRDTARWPRFMLPTLCFHEGLPGHVWQGAYTKALPPIRSQLMFNAYSEGWGLYAEQLADELGMYENDRIGRLGYLQSLQFRACRLVVDTGLHARRWTRDQAIRWFAEQTGNTAAASTAEIDRYCVWPGQACGYRVGHKFIAGLRDKAKSALGPLFDQREFNDGILSTGPVPLDVLDKAITRLIERARRRAA